MQQKSGGVYGPSVPWQHPDGVQDHPGRDENHDLGGRRNYQVHVMQYAFLQPLLEEGHFFTTAAVAAVSLARFKSPSTRPCLQFTS